MVHYSFAIEDLCFGSQRCMFCSDSPFVVKEASQDCYSNLKLMAEGS